MMNITLENMLDNTMRSLSNIVSSENFVGKPMTMNDGTIIVPLSKVSVGFVTGGGEYSEKVSDKPYATATGGGATITPIGFFVYSGDEPNLVKIEKEEDSKWSELFSAAMKLISGKKK